VPACEIVIVGVVSPVDHRYFANASPVSNNADIPEQIFGGAMMLKLSEASVSILIVCLPMQPVESITWML
jgi:hypothetical protein